MDWPSLKALKSVNLCIPNPTTALDTYRPLAPQGTQHRPGATGHTGALKLAPQGTQHCSGATRHTGDLMLAPQDTQHCPGATRHKGAEIQAWDGCDRRLRALVKTEASQDKQMER